MPHFVAFFCREFIVFSNWLDSRTACENDCTLGVKICVQWVSSSSLTRGPSLLKKFINNTKRLDSRTACENDGTLGVIVIIGCSPSNSNQLGENTQKHAGRGNITHSFCWVSPNLQLHWCNKLHPTTA